MQTHAPPLIQSSQLLDLSGAGGNRGGGGGRGRGEVAQYSGVSMSGIGTYMCTCHAQSNI